MDMSNVAALWWAVIFSGLYHGINPGMGWPLAVSAALMEGKAKALPKALLALAIGLSGRRRSRSAQASS